VAEGQKEKGGKRDLVLSSTFIRSLVLFMRAQPREGKQKATREVSLSSLSLLQVGRSVT
jgi:hypothetical protein